MADNDRYDNTISLIETRLQRESSALISVAIESNGYRAWYSRLIGALALLVDTDDVIHLQADFNTATHSGVLVLFTPRLVIRVAIADADSDSPSVETRAVPRTSIRSLGVAISDVLNEDQFFNRKPRTWPGQVTLTVEYADLPERIVIRAPGYSRYASEQKPEGLEMLDALRSELAAQNGS